MPRYVDKIGYNSEKLHLIKDDDGKTLCGRVNSFRNYRSTPAHATCARCIAKNGGETTWPEMAEIFAANIAAREAEHAEAVEQANAARAAFEEAQRVDAIAARRARNASQALYNARRAAAGQQPRYF